MAIYQNTVPKNVKARTILKMGTADEWAKAENFKPLLGEPIIEYAIDENGKAYVTRLMFGDGATLVKDIIPYDKPYIDEKTGNWFIGGEDSGISAMPNISINNEGYWVVNDKALPQLAQFHVAAIYSSIPAMIADYDNSNVNFNDFVLIAARDGDNNIDVDAPENARLYAKVEKKANETPVEPDWPGYKFIGDFSGAKGASIKGEPGITPHIENGNWYIGNTDTGVSAGGIVFIPSIANGVLHWTNNGGLDNPEDVDLTSKYVLTEEDRALIVQDVISQFEVWQGGSF